MTSDLAIIKRIAASEARAVKVLERTTDKALAEMIRDVLGKAWRPSDDVARRQTAAFKHGEGE